MLKRLALLAFAAVAMLTPKAYAADEITIGAYAANPPWEYKNAQGVFEGFEVDVATEAAKRLGKKVTFQDMGFQALFVATSSGRADFAMSSISVTNDRLKNQAFTQPYYDSDGTIVGKADSSIKTLDDLKGKTIGVVASSTGESWAKANAAKLGIADVKSYPSQQTLLLDVQNGRIDGGAGELAGFQYSITKIPNLKILVRIPTGERFALMAKKGLPILAEFNDVISAMKKDGTMDAIHKKWFGVNAEAGTSTLTVLPLPQAE